VARSELLTLIRQTTDSGEPDGVLLGRFADTADASAFAELVRRYARLVWGQCRNLLPTEADADDAFQATFLSLAKTARSIRDTNRLGPWLHGVAYRVCLNARRAATRRAKRERVSATVEATRPVADSVWDAAAAAVHEEVSKLPESLRVPFVLCWLEGKAPTDAAEQLGLPWGTFSSRLSRAKQRLLDRLAARDIGAAVAVGLIGGGLLAPASAVEQAIQLGFNPASATASVLSLTAGGRGMFRTKLLAAVFLAAVGTAAVFLPGWGTTPPPVAQAAPVPKDEEAKKKAIEELWADLASADEQTACRALLKLRFMDVEGLLADKLKPLKLSEERAKELLANLGSDDEKTWKAAYEELSYLDPRLALDLTGVLGASKGQAFDERLAALLCKQVPADAEAFRWCKTGYTMYRMAREEGMKAATLNLTNHPDKPAEFQTFLDKKTQQGMGFAVAEDVKSLCGGYGPNPSWRRAVRAVAMLEDMGTQKAKKVLEDLATGHEDASPTKAAKAALERRKTWP